MINVILLFFTCFFNVPLFGQEAPSKVEYVLTDKIGIKDFNEKSIENLKSVLKNKKFEYLNHIGKDKLNLNYNDKTLIFKIQVNNKDKTNQIFIDALSVGYLYILDENFKIIDNFGLGRNSSNFYPIFKQNGSSTYYVLRESTMRFDGKVRFISEKESNYMNTLNNIIIILFLGSILYLVLYHFGYYCITKNKTYLYYIFFNLSYTSIVLSFGYFFNYFAHIIRFEELVMSYAAISAFFLCKFSRSFLDFKKFNENYNFLLLRILEYSLLAIAIIHPFLPTHIKTWGSSAIDLLVIITIFKLVIDAIIIRKKNPLVYFYLLGWVFTYTGVFFLYAYEYASLFSEYSIIRYSLLIGCFFEMITNSFGLAYQHKQILLEKTKATLEALDKKRYQNAVKMLIHDISNPLTLSIMSSEAIKAKAESLNDPMITKMVGNISKANGKIKTIIDDTKIYEQNYEKLSNEDFATAFDVYKDLNDLFSDKLKEKSLTFLYKGEYKIQLPIKSSILVNNILGNFLSNSIKFSNDNGIILLIIEQIASRIHISIQDQGCGMTPVQLEKIRNKVCATTLGTNSEKGTGFGMQIATTLIQDFNGALEISSSQEGENKGTTYKITFNSL